MRPPSASAPFLDNFHGRVILEAEASLRNVLSKSCLI